jgi:hypothetical protein
MKKLIQLLKRPELLILAYSLGITILVSAVVGAGGYFLFGSFWGTFVIAFGIQFILFAVINTFLQRKDQIEINKILTEQLNAISKFTIRLNCAYCKTPNTFPITLNEENRFKCESCNQVNAVKMQFFAAQITTPLNKVIMPVGENESIEFKTTLS